jgi:hypothetical protein
LRLFVVLSVTILVLAAAGWASLVFWPSAKEKSVERAAGSIVSTADGGSSKKESSERPLNRIPFGAAGFSPEDHFEAREILIADPPKGFEAHVGQMGFAIVEKTSLSELSTTIYRLRTPSATSVPKALKALRARFPGVSIDANHLFQTQAVSAAAAKSTARSLIGWPRAKLTCGSNIKMGMIDSAMDTSHPALKGRKLRYRSFHKKGNKPGPADHGTAVAAILVGTPEWGGLLPGAELLAANMFQEKPSGDVVGNALGLLKAVNWMAKEKVKVLNLSVAGGNNKVVLKAFKKALDRGMILIAASGNWGEKGKPAYPAAYDFVIAVTAFGSKKLIYSHANRGRYVDFAAPGVRLWTAVPGGGGRFQSGTSFASPYIAVMVAMGLARGKVSNAGPDKIRDILRSRAVDLGATGRDNVFGWGFVNLPPDCR